LLFRIFVADTAKQERRQQDLPRPRAGVWCFWDATHQPMADGLQLSKNKKPPWVTQGKSWGTQWKTLGDPVEIPA